MQERARNHPLIRLLIIFFRQFFYFKIFFERIKMRAITYREALREALSEEMALDKNVVLIGEDIGIHDGPFQVTAGLFKKFGGDRVRNTPISEVAIAGAAIGAAAVGLRPVAAFMVDDFLFVEIGRSSC